MNNARKTFNNWFNTAVMPAVPGWTFITGDEPNPSILNKYIGIQWIRGNQRGLTSSSRIRLAQLEVFTGFQDTDGAETACDSILEALALNRGSAPMMTILKNSYSTGSPLPLSTFLTIRKQMESGFVQVPGPSQESRLYILTLEVDYIPG